MEPVSGKFKQALIETRVELAVNPELEADFNKHQHLPGRELSRRHDGDRVILTCPPTEPAPWISTPGSPSKLTPSSTC